MGWATHFRHEVSKAVFNAVDSYAWGRLMRWTRGKYPSKNLLGMNDLRRRFCDKGWRFAHNGVVFKGASSVMATRCRYRGSRIPNPWTTNPVAAAKRLTNWQDTWSARCGESRTAGAAGGPGNLPGVIPAKAPRSDPARVSRQPGDEPLEDVDAEVCAFLVASEIHASSHSAHVSAVSA